MTRRKHEIEAELARTQRELRDARRGYDTVTAALEGGAGDPLAVALARAEKAEAALTVLKKAAAAHHRDGNRETWLALYDALDATPADLATHLVATETTTTTVPALDEESASALLAYWRERGYIDEPEMITLHPSTRVRTVSRGPGGELTITARRPGDPVPITPIGINAGNLKNWITTFPVVIPPSDYAWDVRAIGDVGVQVTRARS